MQPRGGLAVAVEVEQSRPGEGHAGPGTQGRGGCEGGGLGPPVGRRSANRIGFLQRPVSWRLRRIFGDTADPDDPSRPAVNRRCHEREAGPAPRGVLRRLPERAMGNVPGTMQQMGGPQVVKHGGAGHGIEQIGRMPDGRSRARAAPAERVHLEAHRRERCQRPAPDEARRTRDQDPAAHGTKAGQARSRAPMTAGAAGQATAKAGSSKRAPRTASGA